MVAIISASSSSLAVVSIVLLIHALIISLTESFSIASSQLWAARFLHPKHDTNIQHGLVGAAGWRREDTQQQGIYGDPIESLRCVEMLSSSLSWCSLVQLYSVYYYLKVVLRYLSIRKGSLSRCFVSLELSCICYAYRALVHTYTHVSTIRSINIVPHEYIPAEQQRCL